MLEAPFEEQKFDAAGSGRHQPSPPLPAAVCRAADDDNRYIMSGVPLLPISFAVRNSITCFKAFYFQKLILEGSESRLIAREDWIHGDV